MTAPRAPDWLALTAAVLLAIGMVCGLKWAGLFPGLPWWQVVAAVPATLALGAVGFALSPRR